MMRFPNPGSTLQNFVAVYKAAHAGLAGRVVDLDDIVRAVVAANLATSSGYVGAQAICRSTRDDRTRDPLYNQLKMYAELFRSLGWLHPTENRSLNYTFTLLGEQVVAARRYWLPLFCECVIGIVCPSRIIEIKGGFNQRPFAFILRTMRKLQDTISRDEMIVGPLSAPSDRGPDDLQKVVDKLHGLRRSPQALAQALEAVSTERRIQVNTLKNYTRWPIAVLRDTGWTVETTAHYRSGESYQAFQLTPKAVELADALDAGADIRLDQMEQLPADQRRAISLHAHYAMLERAGFDVAPVHELLETTRPLTEAALLALGCQRTARLIYSPFQTLAVPEIRRIFSVEAAQGSAGSAGRQLATGGVVGRNPRGHLFVQPNLIQREPERATAEADRARRELAELLRTQGSIDSAANAFAIAHEDDTKEAFYPLVAHLFQIMGFRCETSRHGVNYQRWDAALWTTTTIPIEIKSPTEERELSTKSVRQALENKVISLARGGIDTQPEVTSLIVGFAVPNERAAMANLIDDIHKAYGFRIGVIAIRSLAKLACLAISCKEMIEPTQLEQLKGFLDV